MSLTLGSGPLSAHPADSNFEISGPAHRMAFEADPRRIRAELGTHTVLDTTRGRLLHETGLLPVLYAPLGDFDPALLERSEHTTRCPFKGRASYWTVRAGGHVAENALWAYEDPHAEVHWLAGFGALYAERMDRWLEEDDVVVPYLRDPYHRVDARRSSRPVEITLAGHLVLRHSTPTLVFETGLPPRAYVEPERLDLVAGERRSACPYKGQATFWSLRVGGHVLQDAAWSYEAPLEGLSVIAGLVSLEHEELEVRIG